MTARLVDCGDGRSRARDNRASAAFGLLLDRAALLGEIERANPVCRAAERMGLGDRAPKVLFG